MLVVRAIKMARGVQDVIGRGSKVHPLYARIVEAKAAKAIVIPAQPAKGLQVQFSSCKPTNRHTEDTVTACLLPSLNFAGLQGLCILPASVRCQ